MSSATYVNGKVYINGDYSEFATDFLTNALPQMSQQHQFWKGLLHLILEISEQERWEMAQLIEDCDGAIITKDFRARIETEEQSELLLQILTLSFRNPGQLKGLVACIDWYLSDGPGAHSKHIAS